MIVFCTLIYDNHNTSDIGMDPYMTTTSVPLLVSTLLNKLPNVHDDQQQVEFFYQNCIYFVHMLTHLLRQVLIIKLTIPLIYTNTNRFLMVSVIF